MNTYSFTIDGFAFHLKQISNFSYSDQNGSLWHKKGNQLISDGGGMIHAIQAQDSIQSDYSPLVKQMGKYSDQKRKNLYEAPVRSISDIC